MRRPILFLFYIFLFALGRGIAQTGPVGSYLLNNNADDSSGYSNHGTAFSTSGALNRFLKSNQCLSFNGSSSYISVPHNNVFNSDSGITVSAWVYPAAFSTGQYILQKANTSTGGYSLRLAANKIVASVGPTLSPTELQSNTNLIVNDWYMVTLRYDGAALKLYVNGALDNSVSTVKTVNSTAGISLGKTSTGSFFNGRMDDVRFYRRTLSDAEISALYGAGGYGTVLHEGKTYHTFLFGSQYWLRENLDVGAMINGTLSQQNNSITEKYCYNNQLTNCNTYGGLYQWDEAMQYNPAGTQGICPSGWRIPTLNDFQQLSSAVAADGNALKAVGQGSGGGAGTNTSGFSAMLSGIRESGGSFSGQASGGNFWSSTEGTSELGNYLYVNSTTGAIDIGSANGTKQQGFSVRCIRSDAPSVTVTFPNGGEMLQYGAQVNILWTSTSISTVKIELTTNNGSTWSTVVASISASAGTYAWTVPGSLSSNCKIRISDAAHPEIYDVSNAAFSIIHTPAVINAVIRCDSVWLDTDYNGMQTDTLDGTGSNSSSGTISNFQWYVNGVLTYNAPKVAALLNTGTNYIRLKLTTTLGDTASALKRVDVYAAAMPTQGAIYSAVSQVGNAFYVASLNNTVYRFDSTAAHPAQFVAAGPIVSTLCISKRLENGKNLIYFGTTNGKIYCLDGDLNLVWVKTISDSGVTTPTVSGNGEVVYAGTKQGKFVALNALTGSYLFQMSTRGGVVSSPVVLELSDETRIVYFGSCGTPSAKPAIYAVKDMAGAFFTVYWTRVMQGFNDSVQSSPAILEEGGNTMIYVGSNDGYLYRTRWDGHYQANWRVNTGGAVTGSPIIDASHIVYIGSNSGTLNGYAWDFTESSSPLKHYSGSSGIAGTPCLGPQNLLFVGFDDGSLLALNGSATTIEMPVQWSFSDSAAIQAPTLITDRGIVFIGDLGGKMYVLMNPQNPKNPGDLAKAQYKWPTYKGSNLRSQTSPLTTAPSAPLPQSPVDSALSMTTGQIVTWIREESAENFWLEVSKTPDFIGPEYSDSTLTAPYKKLTLDSGTPYYWRVSAANGYGRSPWSDTLLFTTAGSTPAQLTVGSSTGNAGETILVSVNGKNVTNLLSMTLKMNVDTSLLVFVEILNKHSQMASMTASLSGTTITVSWTGGSPVTVSDAKLFDIKFTYNGAEYPTPLSLVTSAKNCPLINSTGDTLNVIYTNGMVSKKPSISGKILYNNSSLTPLSNTATKLVSGGVSVDSSVTDVAGAFTFQECASGTYQFTVRPAPSWGGVTATDALKVRRHYTGLEVLTGLKLTAADVNRSSTANSTDGLLIKRRVVGITDTAWTAGDWVVDNPTVEVDYSNVNLEMKAMCAGDVNASYSPSLLKKEMETVRLEPDGSTELQTAGTFAIPLRAGKEMAIAALTLHIGFDKTRYRAGAITSPLNDFLYSGSEGVVHFAWENAAPFSVKDGDTIITLHFTRIENSPGEIRLTLLEGSEAANARGEIILNSTLLYPSSAKDFPDDFRLCQNYPNPFNPATAIRYELPRASNVRIEIFSIIGEKVAEPVSAIQEAGYYTLRWNAAKLSSGPYIYRMTALPTDGTKEFRSVKKLLIIR